MATDDAPEAADAGSSETERGRGLKKVAKKPPPRDKARAKGKERGKTSATTRRSGDLSMASILRVGRGTEQPPEGPGLLGDRGDDDGRVETEISDRATTRALPDRMVTSIADRAVTRALDPSDSAILDRAPTRALDPSDSAILDRAPTRMRESSDSDVRDRAATRVRSPSDADLSDRAPTRMVAERAPIGERTEIDILDHAATLIFKDRSSVEIEGAPRPSGTPSSSPPPIPKPPPVVMPSGPARSDETVIQTPGSGAYAPIVDTARKASDSAAVLRTPPTLPRRRGVLGDVFYLYTAAVGVVRARRELAAADRQLETERQARARRLADLARLALADTSIVIDCVAHGREEIIELEDQRSRRAGAAAGADAEIHGIERAREDEKKQHVQELETLRRNGREMDEKLEPLQRQLRTAWNRASRLRDNMDDLDQRVAKVEGRLGGMAADARAEAEAHIASMRAERQALVQEVPALAAEIDHLEPAIAGLTASRAEGRARADRIGTLERAAVARAAEKVAAIKARRVVDERAEEELAEAQEEALRALGERLAVERPAELGTRLRGIEEHEVAIGTLERRHLELTELLHGVDRWGLVRGTLWVLTLLVATAAALVWSVALRVL